MRNIVLSVAALLVSANAAGAETEFEGTPQTRVEVTLGATTSEAVPRDEREKRRVVITRDGDKYYWASRNNTPLYKLDSGDYVTYVAATGVGYVRVLSPRKATGRNVRYMEHLTVQMGSITYFGK
jgi:hypothetical protein